eukprot:scaffold117253_cov21-Phaeocystis_antarctica.AAC.1
MKRSGVGAAAVGEAAAHGRVKRSGVAASVPPQRRGRGGGAWAGEAERRQCRPSAVGAATANGRMKRSGVGAAAAPWARRRRMG